MISLAPVVTLVRVEKRVAVKVLVKMVLALGKDAALKDAEETNSTPGDTRYGFL